MKVIQEKFDQSTFNKMKNKIKPLWLCETRWVERHTAFEDLYVLYLYIILCLEIISKNEDRNWDPKSVVESSGLLFQFIEPKFFVVFQVCRYLLEFTKSISVILQGSDMEICCAYEMIRNVQAALKIFEIILRMSFIIFSQRQIAWQKGLAKPHLLNPARLVDRS